MDSIKIKIQMTEDVMFKFQLYHMYRKITSVISLLLGIFVCVLSISWIAHGDTNYGLVFLLFGLVLIFMPPFTLKQKSKSQVARNKIFAKPMEYTLSSDGIVLFQQGNRGELKWEDCTKVVYALGNILIYTGKNMSIILPVNQYKNDLVYVKEIMQKNVSPKKIKGFKKLK